MMMVNVDVQMESRRNFLRLRHGLNPLCAFFVDQLSRTLSSKVARRATWLIRIGTLSEPVRHAVRRVTCRV